MGRFSIKFISLFIVVLLVVFFLGLYMGQMGLLKIFPQAPDAELVMVTEEPVKEEKLADEGRTYEDGYQIAQADMRIKLAEAGVIKNVHAVVATLKSINESFLTIEYDASDVTFLDEGKLERKMLIAEGSVIGTYSTKTQETFNKEAEEYEVLRVKYDAEVDRLQRQTQEESDLILPEPPVPPLRYHFTPLSLADFEVGDLLYVSTFNNFSLPGDIEIEKALLLEGLTEIELAALRLGDEAYIDATEDLPPRLGQQYQDTEILNDLP